MPLKRVSTSPSMKKGEAFYLNGEKYIVTDVCNGESLEQTAEDIKKKLKCEYEGISKIKCLWGYRSESDN